METSTRTGASWTRTGRSPSTTSAATTVTGDRYWLDRDNAAVLVETALIVGNERAVAAALAALGKDRLAELIPLVQPAALPKGVGQGVKHLSKTLKGLRTDLAKAAGVDDVQTTKIRRLGWASVGITLGVLFALFIAFRSLSGVNWDVGVRASSRTPRGAGRSSR